MTEIIKGDLVHAPEFGQLECIENGFLILEDGVLCRICRELPPEYDSLPITDWSGRLILQSFTDTHLHAPQYPMVGTCMDVPLLDWLNLHAFPLERKFENPEYARLIYHRLAQQLIENGTTRVIMFSSLHAESTLVLMEELEAAGLVGYVGKVNMDRNGGEGLEETTEGSKEETLRWLEGCQHFRKIKPILTPRFTPSCTDELMSWLGETAERFQLPVQSHLSENDGEIAWVAQLHPDCQRYWETYHKYGLWKEGTVMAHCVHSDEVERKAMLDHHILVSHCPNSNMNICSGVAPIRQMLKEGLWVALGSDIAGGDQLSMLRVMASCIRTSKVKRMMDGDEPLNAAEAYYLAASAGQLYFGRKPGFGLGEPLHAIVIDDSQLPPGLTQSLELRLERCIYGADDRHICAVYSEGQKVK